MDKLIQAQTKQRMEKAFSVLKEDFGTVKTGKASPQLVESIIINAYGGTARLQVMELATIHVVDYETLTMTPFDRTVLGYIDRGIS